MAASRSAPVPVSASTLSSLSAARVSNSARFGRALTTPRAVRHALVYVFGNGRKHGERVGAIDPLSSAPYFRGFREFSSKAPCELDPKLVPRFARGDPPPASG